MAILLSFTLQQKFYNFLCICKKLNFTNNLQIKINLQDKSWNYNSIQCSQKEKEKKVHLNPYNYFSK